MTTTILLLLLLLCRFFCVGGSYLQHYVFWILLLFRFRHVSTSMSTLNTVLVDRRVVECMQQWRMDPYDPEQRRLAKEWMKYVDDNRYYTQAFFMPYSVNGVRGMLLILFIGGC